MADKKLKEKPMNEKSLDELIGEIIEICNGKKVSQNHDFDKKMRVLCIRSYIVANFQRKT